MLTKKAIWTHQSLLPEVWGIHLNIWSREIYSHDAHGTIQDLHRGQWLKRHQEVSGDVTPHVSQLWTIIKDLGWFEEQYPPGYRKLPKDSNHRLWHIFRYKNPAPQSQAHIPPGAVIVIHINNADRSKTVPGNNEISLADVWWYLCQEMVSYAGKCL